MTSRVDGHIQQDGLTSLPVSTLSTRIMLRRHAGIRTRYRACDTRGSLVESMETIVQRRISRQANKAHRASGQAEHARMATACQGIRQAGSQRQGRRQGQSQGQEADAIPAPLSRQRGTPRQDDRQAVSATRTPAPQASAEPLWGFLCVWGIRTPTGHRGRSSLRARIGDGRVGVRYGGRRAIACGVTLRARS